MAALWQIVTGLITIFLLGLGVGWLVRRVQKAIPLLPPNDATKEKWEQLTEGNEAGSILGNLERLLFFGAFWVDATTVIAAWLAFKVASKWNVWSNVISVPKTSGMDGLEFLVARRRWGSQLLTTFLVGTLSNVIIGYLGVAIGRHGYELIRSLC